MCTVRRRTPPPRDAYVRSRACYARRTPARLPAWTAAGLARVGTPAVTTRGMQEAEMTQIAALITEVLDQPDDNAVQVRVKEKVKTLTSKFPLPY